MKTTIAYISAVLLFIIITVACNKELTDDSVLSFNIEFADTTLDSFINNPKATNFGISTQEDTVEKYQLKYEVTEGSGYFLINSTRVEASQFVTLPDTKEQTIAYVGTTVGINKINITIKDAFNTEKSTALTYNVQDIAFTLEAVLPSENIVVGNSLDVTLRISETAAADYTVRYTIVDTDVDTAGSVAINANADTLAPSDNTPLSSGDTIWQLDALTPGTVTILFTAESSLGAISESTITFTIEEISDFTFKVSTLATTLETNTAANLTFEITETTGSASYTMTFSTTQTGTVVYNDITYQPGEEIPVMAGKFNGHYIGELMGSHTVEFTVTNNNTTPVPKTDNLSFTFEDKDTVPPVISITGPEMITHLAGTPYTDQGATATDNIDSDVTVVTTGLENVNTNALGTYIITYTAIDNDDNEAKKTRTVMVVDTQAPTIALNGNASVTLIIGTVFVYEDMGVTVSDNLDTTTNISISTIGEVSVFEEGTYEIKYFATDSSGNRSRTVTRTVRVQSDLHAIINASTLAGPSPLSIGFDAAQSTGGGIILNVNWDFGDGSPSVDADLFEVVTHTFRGNPGTTFTVRVELRDEYGSVDNETITISIRR